MAIVTLSRKYAQNELESRGWKLNLDAQEWRFKDGRFVVSFGEYPTIYFYEQNYSGNYRGRLNIVDMSLFYDWIVAYHSEQVEY